MTSTKAEAKQIKDRLAAAIAAVHIFGPEALQSAIRAINADRWEDDEQPFVNAFITLLEDSVQRKNKILHESFAPKG